jgi:clan AA aspartic protease
MGYVFATLLLSNPRFPDRTPIEVNARVDSAAYLTCIPEHLRRQLQLDETSKRPVTLADGSTVEAPYVGPLFVRFANREAFGGALVLGDEVLLGAIAMEDMNVSVNPRAQKLVINEGPMPGIVGGVRPAQ